jgi:hypothetical protein
MQTSIFTLVDNIGVVWSSEFLGWYCLCPESRSAWIGPILTKKLNNCKIYTIIKQVSGSINCWVKPTEFLWKFEWWRKNTDWHRCSFKYIAIKEMHTAQIIRGFQNSKQFFRIMPSIVKRHYFYKLLQDRFDCIIVKLD